MSSFCTCKNVKCSLHPSSHDKGCSPCISKNLKLRELPRCYFNLLGENGSEVEDCSLESFARIVLDNKKA